MKAKSCYINRSEEGELFTGLGIKKPENRFKRAYMVPAIMFATFLSGLIATKSIPW